MNCPNCGNTSQFFKELSPFGTTQCVSCSYKALHKEFNVDILNLFKTENITQNANGLVIKGINDDYVAINILEDKFILDGEIKYVNSIKLNATELELLIYKLTELRQRLG